MNVIRLFYKGNIRYMLFIVDGQYYLFDRMPGSIIAYLLFPLNWMLYHKVYPITAEEYMKIQSKYSKASKFVLPASLVGGVAVFLNAWIRVNKIDIFQHFDTNFSMQTNYIWLVIGLIVAFFLLQGLYYSRKKSMQKLLGRELDRPFYYKVAPQKPGQIVISFLGLLLVALLMLLGFAVSFLYLGNFALLMGAILMAIICFGAVGGVFSDREKWQYIIVDILSDSGKK